MFHFSKSEVSQKGFLIPEQGKVNTNNNLVGNKSGFYVFGSWNFNGVAKSYGLIHYELKQTALRSEVAGVCAKPELVIP